MTLTNDGIEFLLYAKQIYGQYENVLERYGKGGTYKRKFGVSTQHYSFAVKAFVDMAKAFDMSKYEFAIRETKTAEVIQDVSTMKSEIGVLYRSDFNRKFIDRLLKSLELRFHSLIECQAYVSNSFRIIPAFPLNREIIVLFILRRKFYRQMSIHR